jgi:hypothetical protein
MGDLTRVHIGLYFPDDIIKVAEEISRRFNIIHLFGIVIGGREATQVRNLDIQKHTNGPWYSSGPGGTVESWEHYGYKSWQMVVEWYRPLPKYLSSLYSYDINLNSLRVEIQVAIVVI